MPSFCWLIVSWSRALYETNSLSILWVVFSCKSFTYSRNLSVYFWILSSAALKRLLKLFSISFTFSSSLEKWALYSSAICEILTRKSCLYWNSMSFLADSFSEASNAIFAAISFFHCSKPELTESVLFARSAKSSSSKDWSLSDTFV